MRLAILVMFAGCCVTTSAPAQFRIVVGDRDRGAASTVTVPDSAPLLHTAQVLANEVNEYGPPEYGHGLTEKDALDGWISLFDGKTTFGWAGGKVENGVLTSGRSTISLREYDLKADFAHPGTFAFGGEVHEVKNIGPVSTTVKNDRAGPFEIRNGLTIRSLLIRPRGMLDLFNGTDLTGWKRIDHAKLPKDRWPQWNVNKGVLHAVGGPGAMEYQPRQFGDMILRVEAKMNVRYSNGGLFFRSIPGDFMNGYEAQLYNRCHDGDVSKPWTWATGAIDDRQNARRLVSRDGAWLVQTVSANGPHLATWVNGYQTVDWTDTRAKHENPRQGMRLHPGTIQLQAHDVATDVEFRKVAARALE